MVIHFITMFGIYWTLNLPIFVKIRYPFFLKSLRPRQKRNSTSLITLIDRSYNTRTSDDISLFKKRTFMIWGTLQITKSQVLCLLFILIYLLYYFISSLEKIIKKYYSYDYLGVFLSRLVLMMSLWFFIFSDLKFSLFILYIHETILEL